MNNKSTKEERGSSSTQYEQNPWEETIHPLTEGIGMLRTNLSGSGLSSNEGFALDSLYRNAQSNPFAGRIGLLADDLLAGGKDRTGMAQGAYDEVRASLLPYTTMDTNPYSNEAFVNAVGGMTDDISNRIKSQYAAAGYSPVGAGDFAKTLGEGISRGIAPTWLAASNDLENRKLAAIEGLYGAGNTTTGLLAGLDQTALGNRVQGIDVARSALDAKDAPFLRQIQIEAQRYGIPADRLKDIMGQLTALGQLGGSGTSDTQTFKSSSSTEGWMDTALKGTQALGNIFGSQKESTLTGIKNAFGGGWSW